MGRSLVVFATACASALIFGAAVSADEGPTPQQLQAILQKLHITVRPSDRTFRMPSSSMESTLHCARPGPDCSAAVADRVLTRLYNGPARIARGDIVAFATPELAMLRCGTGPGVFLKRVIGLPGDRVGERNGYVFVNGKRLVEPYVSSDRRDFRTIAATTVDKGHYYLLGDNRSSSCDSRVWGTVPYRRVIGRVIAIYWPAARARRL